MTNFIQTENPFKLQTPPAWWLTMLSDYDAQLVVFPSKIRPVHILARRRRFSNAMAELAQMDQNIVKLSAGMDGDVLAKHNLIFVRILMGDTVRRPNIFQWLRDHDITAQGGGENVARLIETEEENQRRKNRQTMIDNIDHRARDAWRSYQARTGRRAGYGQSRPHAKIMPVAGFTPKESPLAAFSRD